MEYTPLDSTVRVDLIKCVVLIDQCYSVFSSGPPRISQLSLDKEDGVFYLTCTSTDSPPTIVTWVEEGLELSSNGMSFQTLVERLNSTYDNVLRVGDENPVGKTYTCAVENALGMSNTSLTVQGILFHSKKDALRHVQS